VRVARWQPVPVVESAGEILPQHVAMVQALLQDLVVTELAANWPSPNPPISTPGEPQAGTPRRGTRPVLVATTSPYGTYTGQNR
jgi:hypothetical protein